MEVLNGAEMDTALALASWGGAAQLEEEGRPVQELDTSLSAVTHRW
jgi:hypothetical protein